MRKLIFSVLLFLFGLKKNTSNQKRTIIILVDGLSHHALKYALQKNKCPTIAKILKRGYELHPYFCGVPAATTATEALLFYGTCDNIPGFTWYDRKLKSFIRGNRSKELAQFEDSYQKKRKLLQDGSVIMSVYTGGATQLILAGRNLRFPKTSIILKLLQYFALCILYPVQFIRTFILAIKTVFLYRAHDRDKSKRVLETIFLGQFSCFLTEVEIHRGTARIFVDFLLYDEYAHKHGPTHPSALSALHLIDRYIKRITKTIKTSEHSYNVIILSDHGQSPSAPYDEPHERSISDIESSFRPAHVQVIKTYGTSPSSTTLEKIYAVPAGSTLQLYFSHSLTNPYYENELESKYPQCIKNLLEKPAFGWLLIRTSQDSTKLYGKHGSVTFSLHRKPTVIGNPFIGVDTKTADQLLNSMTRYAFFSNNGDIVIFGSTNSMNEVYSFEKHHGTHGGFYGHMCYPFCISNNPEICTELKDANMTMESLFNKIEYNMI